MRTAQLDRNTFHPEVMGGKTCISRSRVTGGTLIGLLAASQSSADILSAYPCLEPEDIDQALAYAAWRLVERKVPLSVQ